MLHLERVAGSILLARSLAISCAIAGCLLTFQRSRAQPPSEPALAQLPIERLPVERLIAQLHQPIASGRAAAAMKLARYGQRGAPASEHLIQCLTDTDSDLRLAAAYALACVQQDSLRAVSALVPLLADEDEHVRYSAQWSIARIAKEFHGEPDANRRRGLISAFETAIRHFDSHEHQARHRVVIELSLARLRQANFEESRLAPQVQTLPEPPAEMPLAARGDGLELASRVYAASDRLGRLQLVESLSDAENNSDDMRRVVIAHERFEADTAVLRYALARWGASGQRLLAEQFEQVSQKTRLDAADAAVVELLLPTSKQQRTRLLELVADRAQAIEIRLAAMAALAAAQAATPECTECLLNVLADGRDEYEVRAAAAETLASLGTAAAAAEARLVKLLQSEKDPWLRPAIARALGRTSTVSPLAAQAVCAALLETPADGEAYSAMLECCAAFGTLSVECVPQLVAGLNHDDEQVRIGSVQCLEQIGPTAGRASDALVARIVDSGEHISVKNAAAAALSAIGDEGLVPLAAGLSQHRDPRAREHVLRALAIAGPAAEFACGKCLAELNDSQAPTSVRTAAATALGAIGKPAAQAVPKLLELSTGEHPEALRAASLLAAAQIDPDAARQSIEPCSCEKGMLLRASAACAYRLVGETKTGFDMLVELLDGSDTDQVVELALAEFGPAAEPWLLEVAGDPNASRDKRLACFRIAAQAPAPAWPQLLPLLDVDNLHKKELGDETLGDELAMTLEGQVSEDPRAVSLLLAHLRDHDLTPATHARMVRLLSPDGLGAASDEDAWQVGLALHQPAAIEALAAADGHDSPASAEPFPESVPPLAALPPAGPRLPSAPALPAGGSPPEHHASQPATEPRGGSGSGGTRNPASQPVQPRVVPRATGAVYAVPGSAATPRVVEVFYGTNRSRIATEPPQHELAGSLLATVGGGLLAMLLCLIGFLRTGHRPFAIVALIAIGVVAPFGFQAAQSYSRSTLRPTVAYGGEYRPEIELGMCEVSIPPGHKPGMLESPNLLKLEVKQDVDKHVVLTSVEQLSQDRFFEQLHERMEADGKNILVFIHGYNVSFEDAARRTAQMAADLDFPGAPVFYSWPSQANWYGYRTDKENIELSVTQIKSFLLELAAQSNATTINLVAHSMGNVGLTQALKEMEQVGPQPLFNQVVLAAPDIDADVFKNRVAPYIVTKAQHVTLYTSQTDLALIASRYFNSGPRVGDSGAGVLLFPGIDTIDATAVDSSLLGHSYYGSNVSVLTDLGCVLQNQPIDSRQYLRAIIDAAQPYWAFDPLRISQNPRSGAQR